MKVYDLLYLDKQNEERVFKNSKKKKILFVVFFIIGITSLTLFKKGLYHVGNNGSIPMIVWRSSIINYKYIWYNYYSR